MHREVCQENTRTMKIGINRWTLPDELRLAECFQMAKRAGFDSIEINIAEDGELTPASAESDVRALVAAAAQAGIELSSLSTGLGWRYPITSPDEGIRRQGAETIRKMLDV